MVNWEIPKMWEGGECWILGGGTSMPRQFGVPEALIQEVVTGKKTVSEYSPYLSPLFDQHVIGVNMAYLFGDWISVLYFGDRAFFKRNKHALIHFHNLVVTHAPLTTPDRKFHYKFKHVFADQKKYGLSTNPKTVVWNKNSGSAAINLAVLFGAKRIKLLGFDMKPGNAKHTHWHSSYGKYRITPRSFERFLVGFDQIAEDAKKLGVEILNINSKKTTAVKQFPIVKLQEVL